MTRDEIKYRRISLQRTYNMELEELRKDAELTDDHTYLVYSKIDSSCIMGVPALDADPR